MAASTYFAQVQQLYIAYFGRPADPVGQSYWATQIDAANGSIASVIAGFSASTESAALFGNKSTIDKVTAIYQNAFGRAPEPAGLAYWVAQLDSGKVSQAQASWTIQQSAGPGDAAAVQNKLTAAQAFTAQIDTTAEIQGYQGADAAASARAFLAAVTQDNATATAAVNGAAAAVVAATAVGVVGTTFTLTTGVDTFVGTANADTFNGYINTTAASTTSTLTAADVITGGAGVDTLAIVVEGTLVGGALPNATITGVENFSIRDVADTASVYNFANVQGEAKVISNVSSNAVTFQNLGTNTVVAVQGNNSSQVGDVTFNMATATDAVNLVLDGGLKNTVAGTNVINTAGTATAATISSTGAANTVGTVTLAAAGTNTITSLTINAATDLTATLVAADYAATAALTVTGAGKVNLGTAAGGFDGSSIDASTNTGGLTVAATAALTSFKGSTGNDVLTGTGITGAAVIDAGAGIDSVAATLVNIGNAAVFKNFEQIELAGAGAVGSTTLDAALLTGSTITGVTINGGLAGGFALSNLVETAAGFNVGINASAGQATTLGFTAASVAGTADVLNYNFAGTTGAIAGGTITSQGIETINISSKGGTGVTNSLTVFDNAAKSIVITGDKALTLDVTGQAAASATAASALTSIDASAATAGVNITTHAVTTGVQSALAIKGSAFVDNIIVATTGVANSVGATVTTGAGNDTVNVAAATAKDAAAPQFTTITDFAKGDSLQFAANTTFTTAKVDVSAQTTLLGAIGAATGAVGTAQWFTLGGDTYIVDNVATAGFDAADVVVKLSGVLDLSHATNAAVAGTVTFA